jgi:putative ABC transport system substrate-binding protein
MNNRRKLVIALGAGALAAPLASFAQPQGKVWRVGFLSPNSRPASIEADFQGAFPRAMRERGYVEGKNLAIDWRFAENRRELLDPLAAELVGAKVDVIVTLGSPATFAAQKATSSIPIIFVGPGSPVSIGLVKSLARPGGNTTGLSSMTGDLAAKRMEMLLAMTSTAMPKVSRVAVLVNPRTTASRYSFDATVAAGEKLGVAVQRLEASTPQEIESAFARARRDKAGALVVTLDALYEQQTRQIGELSLTHQMPAIGSDRMHVESGLLMTYGTSLVDLFGHAARYVDKIFKGAKPADVPVEQPTKLELIINGKTAKALGLTIPQSLLISADKVIE